MVHAGQPVAMDVTGLVVLANRALWQGNSAGIGYTERYKVLGLAADDCATTSNTFIQNDPVGSTFLVGTGFSSYANGWYVGVKRALGDYQNEAINSPANLTAAANSAGLTQRGVGVYLAPGQFVTDQVNLTFTTSSGTADTAYTASSATPGLPLTVGASGGAGAGVLIPLAASSHGPVLGVLNTIIDNVSNPSNSLCVITLL